MMTGLMAQLCLYPKLAEMTLAVVSLIPHLESCFARSGDYLAHPGFFSLVSLPTSKSSPYWLSESVKDCSV